VTDVFISYSRKDVEFVRRLTASLEDRGVDVWFDQADIHAGVKWSTAIQQGLRASNAMILIISPDSMASTNVEDEWQYFLDKKKPIIPVLLQPADIHFQLNRIQYIDFTAQTYEAALEQLIAELGLKGVAFTGLTSKAARPVPQTATVAALPEDVASGDPRSRILQIVVAVVIVIAALLIREVYVASVPDPRSATQTAADQTAVAERSTPFATPTQAALTATTPEATPEITPTFQTAAVTPIVAATPTDRHTLIAALNITSTFEGFGYASYNNYDSGIISYGRSLYTLASGSLAAVLVDYLANSTTTTANKLRNDYLDRVNAQDETLRNDETFQTLLIAAADEIAMQDAQDAWTTENYWNRIYQQSIAPRGIQTPLGQALIYDIGISNGINNQLIQLAETALGVPALSRVGENGVSEETMITQLAHIYQQHMQNLAEQMSLPGLARRGDFWVTLIESGNWQLRGNSLGNLVVNGRTIYVGN